MLALDKYPIDDQLTHTMEDLNFIFVTIFTLEFILKLTAFGLRGFFQESSFSYFDALIIFFSFTDIIISSLLMSH